MAALEFTEIPQAGQGAGRDSFELFAREFLVAEGFNVVEHPDRGADGGRDIIAEEERAGPGGKSIVRWLVSCKHKAHSGVAVSQTDDANIRDRLGTHRCQGFVAFYSTVPTSGLSGILNGLKPQFEFLQLDRDAIERKLLDSPRGRTLAARYMPKSYNSWILASHAVTTQPRHDPQLATNRYFLRQPHSELDVALAEASARSVPVFAVVFDAEHPTHSKMDHTLGYFMEYQTTKRLVDQHFVPAVVSSNAQGVAELVPPDDPLEKCLWVVLGSDGSIIRREGLYANPDVGLERVRQVISKLEVSAATSDPA
jgi:hypothetical protein